MSANAPDVLTIPAGITWDKHAMIVSIWSKDNQRRSYLSRWMIDQKELLRLDGPPVTVEFEAPNETVLGDLLQKGVIDGSPHVGHDPASFEYDISDLSLGEYYPRVARQTLILQGEYYPPRARYFTWRTIEAIFDVL